MSRASNSPERSVRTSPRRSRASDPLYVPVASYLGVEHIKRERTGCLSCRIRRKRCSHPWELSAPPPTAPCGSCERLKIECLGYSEKRPQWMASEDIVVAMREEIKSFLRPFVQPPVKRKLSLQRFYESDRTFIPPFPIPPHITHQPAIANVTEAEISPQLSDSDYEEQESPLDAPFQGYPESIFAGGQFVAHRGGPAAIRLSDSVASGVQENAPAPIPPPSLGPAQGSLPFTAMSRHDQAAAAPAVALHSQWPVAFSYTGSTTVYSDVSNVISADSRYAPLAPAYVHPGAIYDPMPFAVPPTGYYPPQQPPPRAELSWSLSPPSQTQYEHHYATPDPSVGRRDMSRS